MEGAAKNIATILIIITFAFGGYYLYIQRGSTSLQSQEEQMSVQSMLARTQVFIERSQELDRVALDLSILEDERFRSLKVFSKPVKEQPVGRPDPFAAAGASLSE